MSIQEHIPGWNIFDYLPPAFAIYLIIIASFPSRTLESLLQRQLGGSATTEQRTYITEVALDWGTRVSFLTSIIAAVLSVFVTFSDTQSYGWAALIVIVLLVVYLPLVFHIMHYKLGDMVRVDRTILLGRTFNRSPAFVYDMILIVVNVLLLLAVLISQILATQ